MKDRKMLAAIRQRDADFDYIAPHWQAQQDRRFLLQLVADPEYCPCPEHFDDVCAEWQR